MPCSRSHVTLTLDWDQPSWHGCSQPFHTKLICVEVSIPDHRFRCTVGWIASPQREGTLVSVNINMFGNRVFSDVIKWDFPGKSTGVGCYFLLQRIFPTQGSNPDLPHCRKNLYCLSHQGSQFKIRSYWLVWILNPVADILLKRREDTPGHTPRRGHMKTEVETGVIKDCQDLQASTGTWDKAREESPLESLWGGRICSHLHSVLLASRMQRLNFCYFKPPTWW